ncbi:NAD(P)/FAD-dependent oxidoreductase [Kineosporia sp. J2-2]|uniref:NAD(P)/FAD-dependent oxidoreductase n=1 Tax=Kineosporia corallincola TaxID=2835133 RepID=A0ABS5TTB2_9ACTN|nr:NAD(P)/FAD-dependent oxidoreductase [Kineosporia corallincola]MBT0774056.1 NAD(P)/FAD-dependent oxidoreductase [Kineosporia corallincola]
MVSELDVFDVIVIGAGPAGENVAGRTVAGGLSTAVVERELVGGECSYWGCIPSKTLIRPGDVIAAAQRVPGAAAAVTGTIDVQAALARRDWMTSNWDDSGQVPWLDEVGITLVRGHARLTGPRTVQVTDSEGVTRTLTANRAVVLATGTKAVVPPIPGLAEANAWTNRGVTEMKEIPHRLVVIGGGFVGAEMAQAVKRLGAAEVTVLEGGPHLLSREEPFAGEEVGKAFAAEGISVRTGVHATAVTRHDDGTVTVTLDDGAEVTADELLVATGRKPATEELGLDTVGLTPGRPVEVDEQLRATGIAQNDWLYAVGDVNGLALLTHMGKYQARILGDVLLGKDAKDRSSRDVVPRVTFTDPQVCAVGLTEKQARERGLDIRVISYPTGGVSGAVTSGDGIEGTSQIIVDTAREVIVGATFTGPGVSELLHSATIAISAQVSMQDLWHAVPSFPTVSEVWLRLLEAYGL